MSKAISGSVTGPVVLAPATDNPLYITNTGTVTSTGTADGVDGGTGTTWTISNAGVVSAASGNGVSLASSGIVGNTGSISGHDALVLHAGGSVTNNVGGSISGLGALGAGLASGAGVYITGAAGAVTNLSAISGIAYGVGFGAGGLVTNTSAITGGEDGVIIQGAIGTISNSGNITGTVDDGVALFAGGSVTNNVGGSISGQGALGAGVFITGGAATVTNAGSIAGPNHHAVLIADGGSLTNEASGVISAVGVGVFFEIQAGTLTNAGQITATGTDGTGVYLENGGSVTNSSTGTITGHKFGVFLEGGFTTLANYGSISGATYDGVVLGLGGTVTNAAGASISGGNVGVYIKYRAAGTVTNSGNISATGTGSAGVDLADGGNVTNNSTGSISGNSFGVFITGAAGTVANTGSITSVKYGGVELVKGGSVTNSVGGSITGGSAGVYVGTAASGTVINSGNIHAASATGAGVDLSHGGSVTNNAGGSISGGGFGVFTTGAIATVSNSGSISGSHGVGLEAGGSITNNSGGSISGQVDGIFAQGATATLTNAGSVTATAGAGADIEAGGSVTNLAGGIISGSSFGVFISGAAGTVTNDASASISGQVAGVLGQGFSLTLTNAGSISATAGAGVDLEAGGSVTNLAGATISGSTSGIFVNGGSGTVTNAGTISGGSYAVDFAGSGTNRLVVDPGAVFNGKVTGGTGTSTLELASGTSSISGVGTGAFDNFKILAIDVGATWTFNGANAALTVLDKGTLNIAGSLVVSTAIDASSTGQFQLGSGATLEVAAATGSTTQINFQGASSELIVDNAALFGTSVGSASYTGPQLEHFVGGDSIDLKNFSSAGVTLNYNASTGVLQVSNSAHQVASFEFQTSSLGSLPFNATSDGATGIIITDGTVIGTNGSVHLVQVGANYFLDPAGGGIGPELIYGGAPVTAGQFGSIAPIAAVETASGYDIAWKIPGTNQFTFWATDSNGHYVSNLTGGLVSGTSFATEQFETVFGQDLNGDGSIGVTSSVIQTAGSTGLLAIAENYYIYTNGTGPELKYAGAPVTAGEFGSIAPIGAIQTSSGYEIVWQIPGTHEFTFWSVDNNGNYTGNMTGLISGTNFLVESAETAFGRDLNGDGSIGVTSSVIQTAGSTSLLAIAENYYIYTNGTGPELKYAGAPVTAGEFGSIAPIGAIQTSSGYEIVWQIPGTHEFTFWSVDNNGNYTGNMTGLVSGTNFLVESAETAFGRDLNGDGTIGVTSSVVQTDGSTSLLHIAENYYLYINGSGPELKYAGAPVADGEFGSITPVGAIQTSTGYDVAWQIPGTNQFTFWSTDSNGNYTGNLTGGLVTGGSAAEEPFEQIFHQDFDGDGNPTGPAIIQMTAAPAAQTLFDGKILTLEAPSTFHGEIVGFNGNGTPAGSDQIDLRGINFNAIHSSFDGSSDTLSVSDGSTAASFHFVGQYSQQNFQFADDGNGGTLLFAAPTPPNDSAPGVPGNASVTLAGQDTFVFAPNFGQLTLTNFAPATDTLDFNKSVFANINALVAATHDDSSGNAVITDAAHDTITLLHVTTAQVLAHQSDFHFV